MSKKRHRSLPGSDSDGSCDIKRIKIEEATNDLLAVERFEKRSKKKKKHRDHLSSNEAITDCAIAQEKCHSPEIADESILLKAESICNQSVETEFENYKKVKKPKRHRHQDISTTIELPEEDVKQESINSLDVEIVDVSRLDYNGDHSSRKKKKKHQRRSDDDCLLMSDAPVEPEVVDLVGDEYLRHQASVLIKQEESFVSEKPKKKKKKHRKEKDEDATNEGPCLVPVLEHNIDESRSSDHVLSQKKSSGSFDHSLSFHHPNLEMQRPLQFNFTTGDLRYKAGPHFKECELEQNKECVWWEDVASDPNLEMWLVRAPLDFPGSILDGAPGKLYDSVVIPEPNRPGKKFQISMQGVQQSKLVVLLPSKQDKKLHVASDVNGYVTITRMQSTANETVELKSEVHKNHKAKAAKSTETSEALPDITSSHKKHKKSRHSVA